MDDESDVSAPDNESQSPETVQSPLNTSESSELAGDAASFAYIQLERAHMVRAFRKESDGIRKETQKETQSVLEEVRKETQSVREEVLQMRQELREEREESRALRQESRALRQESREERQRHAEEMKAAKAREAALKQMVQVLQVNNPQAKVQADALRDQTRLAERRRRRCRALRQQLQRMYLAEKKKVVHDYTRIVLDRMASHSEPGGKVLMSMESIAASRPARWLEAEMEAFQVCYQARPSKTARPFRGQTRGGWGIRWRFGSQSEKVDSHGDELVRAQPFHPSGFSRSGI